MQEFLGESDGQSKRKPRCAALRACATPGCPTTRTLSLGACVESTVAPRGATTTRDPIHMGVTIIAALRMVEKIRSCPMTTSTTHQVARGCRLGKALPAGGCSNFSVLSSAARLSARKPVLRNRNRQDRDQLRGSVAAVATA